MWRCVMRAVGLSAALALAACAGGPSASVGGDPNVTGDENGGKIVDAIGPQQSQAMRTVTDYCARHDKKGFITRMDFDARTITFECRRQTRTG